MPDVLSELPDRLLLHLEWRVIRRLDGLLHGDFRTARRGSGMDFAGLRAYSEGDEARHIDWNATARLGEVQLRQFNEDRELTVWLVLDRSGSMSVRAPERSKSDVLAAVALALARLFGRGGNRVGAILHDGATTRVVPPGTGRAQALRIAREGLRGERSGSGPDSPSSRAKALRSRRGSAAVDPAATTDLAAMLAAAASAARRRGLVIVVSDFIGTGDWPTALARLAQRHENVAIRIVDAADEALPEAGVVLVEDAETGEQLLIDSGDPGFRARLREQVAERESALAAGMRRARVPAHRIDTEADLARSLVRVAATTRWRRG